MAKSRKTTPVRDTLRDDSPLQAHVRDGIRALKNAHRAFLNDVHQAFGDSLDIDSALKEGHEQAHRWDYLLGHTAKGTVIGLEPHSAKDDQISRVIAKKVAARQQLATHLRDGMHVSQWIWIASGSVDFANTEKARLRLDQNGIRFVSRQVLETHLR